MAVESINIVAKRSKADKAAIDAVNRLAQKQGRKPTDMARILMIEAAAIRTGTS